MKTGYKSIRTTVVLALHSQYLKSIEDKVVLVALSNAVGVNYDLGRLPDGDLEVLSAYFDDEVAGKIRDEYVFIPELGNVRDNKAPIASCSLCGKGDSRDDGANADHIRYEFKLTNTARGEEVWCGSTCIINHAIRIAGAGTSAEAKKLLERSFREHLRSWQRQEWREQNPDHTDIPALYETARHTTPWSYRYAENALELLGLTYQGLRNRYLEVYGHYGRGEFRTATRFYQRSEFLTPKKAEVWAKAKELRRLFSAVDTALAALDKTQDERERQAIAADFKATIENPLHGANIVVLEAKTA